MKSDKHQHVFIVAGGTGGHINAALAIGDLLENDYQVLYLTGKRELDYKLFSNKNVLHLDAQPLRYKNPFKLLNSFINNILTFFKIILLVKRYNPKFILGAGGYVCGPTILAGFLFFKKTYIVEQNSVMGLTNKLLSWFSTKIFVHFKKTIGLNEKYKNKVIVSGNPIRNSINSINFKRREIKDHFNILVFGGSLGALEINLMLEKFLNIKQNFKINIKHQTGLATNNISKWESCFHYESYKYIDNMAQMYDWADFCITRAGASTISELRVVQKPCLLIPYPFATDNHQKYNAEFLKEEVNFLVYIHSVKELVENDCLLLNQIISDVFNTQKIPPQWIQYHDKSTLRVIEEIKKDMNYE